MAPSLDAFRKRLALANEELLQNQGFINDEWVQAKSAKSFDVEDPSTREILCSAPEMSAEDTKLAITAADAAFKSFSKTTARSRARMLRKMNDLMLENKADIAKIIVAENGKPQREGEAEVDYAASFLEWFASEAERAYGMTIPAANPNSRIYTIKQPIGVVCALCPWNLPIAMAARKVGAAIAAGCTLVLKPAGETPFASLIFGVLGKQCGFPPGVINIVVCNANTAEVGLHCCTDPRVKKISLTGSTRVGKLLLQQGANTLKKMSLELGGNAPFVIFDDANLTKAVQGLLVCKTRNGGQTCVAANRILVQKGVVDRFIEILSSSLKGMVVGGGSDPKSVIGPLISSRAVEKVKQHVEQACQQGGKVVWTHPSPVTSPQFKDGYFYPPSILLGLNRKMDIWAEETFGPLAAICTFETEEEAFELANDASVGLGSYVYTENISRAMRAADAIRAGMIGINTGMLSACESPFGGINESGYGKEGSAMGIEEYLITKAVNIDISS
ncbi:hypothetical protein CBS101457_000056 [Exobasidium rhododendri]|nr:hypothetical protein CBS101457_000056 [Exobasidium rhododendri]